MSNTKNFLHVNLFFELPEGFNGTVADATRLLADYMESPAQARPLRCDDDADERDLWEMFTTRGEGSRFAGKAVAYLDWGTHDARVVIDPTVKPTDVFTNGDVDEDGRYRPAVQ